MDTFDDKRRGKKYYDVEVIKPENVRQIIRRASTS